MPVKFQARSHRSKTEPPRQRGPGTGLACFEKLSLTPFLSPFLGSLARVHFIPAKKADRISGWQPMKRRLQDAGKPNRPGLYVSRDCKYFLATVSFLPRDSKRVEDVDSSGPDYADDAVRYDCLRWQVVTEIDLPPSTDSEVSPCHGRQGIRR